MLQHEGGRLAAAAAAAISAARSAYSPYTRCPAGVALVTAAGGIYAGFCMESAAHNPGMLPLQAALVAALVYGGLPHYEVVRPLCRCWAERPCTARTWRRLLVSLCWHICDSDGL